MGESTTWAEPELVKVASGMSQPTAEQIAQRAVDLKLLTEPQLDDVWSELGQRQVAVEDLTRVLLRRALLTNYQVERLLKGETRGFFYGQYKVLYLVGTGSFARVFRCENTDNGEIVAVKVLRNRFTSDPKTTEQFQREGEMGRRLRHPAIVSIQEVYSKANNHYLVMEFVEGRNLREFVKTRKKIDPLEATQITAAMTSGLSYAAAQGICHRDLKMTNVLISSRGQPKLLDFGLASLGEVDGEEGGENPRTIDYAGLERATGVRKDDPRSDIFFMGCMYYNLLTGKPPLAETKDRTQRLSRSRYLEIPPILQVEPAIPPMVAAVVGKAMDPNAERRYQTPAEMLVDLKSLEQRLKQVGTKPVADDQATGPDVLSDGQTAAPTAEASGMLQRTVMLVESNAQVQDVLRTGLKRAGYRVLVISNPAMALDRCFENARTAECVIFSTGELGEKALEAFNGLAADSRTSQVPAILFVKEKQVAWKSRASLASHRVVVSMPINLRDFRQTIATLIDAKNSPAPGSAESDLE